MILFLQNEKLRIVWTTVCMSECLLHLLAHVARDLDKDQPQFSLYSYFVRLVLSVFRKSLDVGYV